MDKDLEDYYSARFDMFSSQGWKDLMEDVDGMIDATDKISGIKDEKDLHFKRGELSLMKWLKGLKEITNLAYEDLKNAKSDI